MPIIKIESEPKNAIVIVNRRPVVERVPPPREEIPVPPEYEEPKEEEEKKVLTEKDAHRFYNYLCRNNASLKVTDYDTTIWFVCAEFACCYAFLFQKAGFEVRVEADNPFGNHDPEVHHAWTGIKVNLKWIDFDGTFVDPWDAYGDAHIETYGINQWEWRHYPAGERVLKAIEHISFNYKDW